MNSRALFLPALALSASVGCSSAEVDETDDPLTSVTARSRTLMFDGFVFVSPSASDSEVLAAVRKQTQTAFGALRTSNVGVNSRELRDVDVKTFRKKSVKVVDTASPSLPAAMMTRVDYRFTDNAVVPVEMAKRSSLSLAVLRPNYAAETDRILKECTANDSHAQDFRDSLWYAFDPANSPNCKSAMSAEAAKIEASRKGLNAFGGEISKVEANRLYIPITVSLGADKTNQQTSYPEYDRLFSGGVEKGVVTVGLVNGFVGHDTPEDSTDTGFPLWLDELRAAFSTQDFLFKSSEKPIGWLTLGGKTLTLDPREAVHWLVVGDAAMPSAVRALSPLDAASARTKLSDQLVKNWLTFEANIQVKIGSNAPTNSKIRVNSYFGSSDDPTPHKRAIKTSDIFLYNGHSYIGYGPLDPKNFRASDFPSSYQILFINGCVSYNYYEKDYIPLKSGGTKNLDLVTNGLETPVWGSGKSTGTFIGGLLSGKQPSWIDLLKSASMTDELRVVDGELDNTYSPKVTPITVVSMK